MLDELLEEICIVENGKEKSVTKQVALIKKFVNGALTGDKTFSKMLIQKIFELSQEREDMSGLPMRITRIVDDVPIDLEDRINEEIQRRAEVAKKR